MGGREGTASYSQARMYQLMAEKGGFKPFAKDKDPQYHGFPNAKAEYETMISRITAPRGQPITFFHSMYNHGMAQCLVLDRVRPGWKEEMREKGMTQFALIEKELPLDEEAEKGLLAEAKKRFDKGGLVFESGATPVIFGLEYMEWIDPDPAPDQSDMKIESEKQEGNTHVGVKITTDGFTLEADQARVEWSEDVVKIYPMPR